MGKTRKRMTSPKYAKKYASVRAARRGVVEIDLTEETEALPEVAIEVEVEEEHVEKTSVPPSPKNPNALKSIIEEAKEEDTIQTEETLPEITEPKQPKATKPKKTSTKKTTTSTTRRKRTTKTKTTA